MLKFKIVENSDNFICCHYFPEGKEDFGIILLDKRNGSIMAEKVAKTDEFKRYFFHMLDKMEEFISKKQYEKEGIIAWY